ncbi:DUF4040 domain-containing protein [Vallitalea sp.]|jgi:uncharacterized MnhB-related membrane protein|uniref:DUF4040 domain-containing protein n=1 Tax=Vallitalea sp. TaxID=1882829 RepID=UPI00260105FE|nr:DUF4040 domain-containing protein [Vallitalea sp.]MCT4686415.1 DUF4040 domain-containing protein [Vallitalea sp.]
MLEVVLILLVVLAVLSVQTNTLRRAIVYLCVFSLLCSFCYLLYQAPDVAIAEAVIGCTLSTIIYLVALNKYKVFRVYYIIEKPKDTNSIIQKNALCKTLSNYSYEKELELDIVISDKNIEEIVTDYPYDVIVQHNVTNTTIYGDKSNYHFDDLISYIDINSSINVNHDYILEDEGDSLL